MCRRFDSAPHHKKTEILYNVNFRFSFFPFEKAVYHCNDKPPFIFQSMKKILFLDRDGTLVIEPTDTYLLDSLEKLEFYPGVFTWLGRIVRELDFQLVMITNQDGLGTEVFPEEAFLPSHNMILKTFRNEGINFEEVLIDRTYPEDNADTRKPGTGLLKHYMVGDHDLTNSFVIGDRLTDMELAKNLGCKGIWINTDPDLGADEILSDRSSISPFISLITEDWEEIFNHLSLATKRNS